MNRPLSSQYPDKYTRILPWFHILGAALVVVLAALFAAVHSPLGQEISAGESPGFDWIRANITRCIGFALAYLILVCWLQIKHLRQSPPAFRMMSLLICIEMAGIALVALLLYYPRTNFLPLVLTVLLVSLLLQVLITLWLSDRIEDNRQSVVSQKYSTHTGLFLFLLFVVGAAVSFLYRNWEWKLVYFSELDLLQLFNVLNDPSEKNNLLGEEPRLAAELEQKLLEYLETVEGKTYRSVLSKGDP